ncbi:MAG TPA: HNH endonuclease signature motif containing protein [Anaeromyxobacter sp.]
MSARTVGQRIALARKLYELPELKAALSVGRIAGRWVLPGEALAVAAAHFIRVWKDKLKERTTPQKRALARDRWCCTAPGCSRTAVHAYHVEFRSRGGDDDLGNLTSLCAAHHLAGIHGGLLRVTGTAPDGLIWQVTH